MYLFIFTENYDSLDYRFPCQLPRYIQPNGDSYMHTFAWVEFTILCQSCQVFDTFRFFTFLFFMNSSSVGPSCRSHTDPRSRARTFGQLSPHNLRFLLIHWHTRADRLQYSTKLHDIANVTYSDYARICYAQENSPILVGVWASPVSVLCSTFLRNASYSFPFLFSRPQWFSSFFSWSLRRISKYSMACVSITMWTWHWLKLPCEATAVPFRDSTSFCEDAVVHRCTYSGRLNTTASSWRRFTTDHIWRFHDTHFLQYLFIPLFLRTASNTRCRLGDFSAKPARLQFFYPIHSFLLYSGH